MKVNTLEQCYIYTSMITGFDIDASKTYEILVFLDKEDAIVALQKNFEKVLAKTHLRIQDKEKIRQKFEDNLANGNLSYHFRDNRTPDEPQYFGKVHQRSILRQERPLIGGYPIVEKANSSWNKKKK